MPWNWKTATGALLAALAGLPTLTTDVAAQTAKTESVLGRPRPDFDPLGIELDEVLNRVGILDQKTVQEKRSPLASFIVSPVTELEMRGQSNIFRTEHDTKADEIFSVRPSLAISSDWNNHALNFRVAGDIGRYFHHDGENYEDVRTGAGGRLDVSDTFALDIDTRFERVHEMRGVPEDVGFRFPPVNMETVGLKGGARYQADLLLLHLKGKIDHLVHKDGDPATTPLRDRNEAEVGLRTGWELSPGTMLFVEPTLNSRVYDHEFDSIGTRQGSQGYRALVGVSWDVSGVTFIEAAIGWLRQNYDEPGFEPTQGPSVDVKAIWNPTEVMTLTANIQRRVEDSTSVDPLTGRPQPTSGVLISQATLGFDYEFLENLIFSTKFDLSDQQFEGGSPKRKDFVVTGSLGFDYRIGNKWYARLGYDTIRRSSNLVGASFEDQFISFRVGEHL
jgi:hypothetical protein